jgi:hypothetical protein
MSSLTNIEKRKLEKLLDMGGGYVLDFSNRTFAEFVYDSTGLDVDDIRYNYASGSKANRLRAFWQVEDDHTVGKLLADLLEHRRELGVPAGQEALFCDGQRTIQRLLSQGRQSASRVFISYAREDIDYARKMFHELTKASYDPWLDHECLLPGQRWEPTIEQAIRESRYFLALISSRSSAKRGYVQKEISKALDLLGEIPENEIFLIPARLDECEPSHSALRGVQWVDLFPSWEVGVERIVRALEAGSRR